MPKSVGALPSLVTVGVAPAACEPVFFWIAVEVARVGLAQREDEVALIRAGHRLVADDLLVVDVEGERARVVVELGAADRRVRLDHHHALS
jgi:hypothetical protein